MTDQPTPEAAPFVLWLDASDASVATCDGIRWPDGTATVHHRHFAGMTSTHASAEAAAWAAHGKQARIVWPDASERPEPAPACDHRCTCGHDQQDHSARYCGRCADPCNSSGHYPDDCDARTTPDNPAASNNETDNPLRDRYAAAIWERQNPGRQWADCEYRWRADAEADADAVMAVRDTELQQLRGEVERMKHLVAASSEPGHAVRMAAANAQRAETAEAKLAAVRQLLAEPRSLIDRTRLRAALDGPADTTPPATPGQATVTIRIHAPSDENAGQWAETIRDLVTAEHGQDMRLDIRITPPPAETQPADTCRPVQVDAETIRVHGSRPLTGLELGYAAQIVAAARRKLADNPPVVRADDGTESALTRRIRAQQRGLILPAVEPPDDSEPPVPCPACTRARARGFTVDALAHPGCADTLATQEPR